MSDTHDEWIDLNGPRSTKHDGPADKNEMQERVRQEKAAAHDRARGHGYRAYRRAGLRPWCAVRFMAQHAVGL